MWVVNDESNDQYCFINVGRAAGKVKFCMLDKDKTWIGDVFTLRAFLMSGSVGVKGPSVQVLVFPKDAADSKQVITIQQLIWLIHHPEKAEGAREVTHINGNTMDNRIDNLAASYVGKTTPTPRSNHTHTYSQDDTIPCWQRSTPDDSSIYSLCIRQLVGCLPWMNVPECLNLQTPKEAEAAASHLLLALTNHSIRSRLTSYVTANGKPAYNECHYLPCTNMERRRLEYDSCGGCRAVRYCSSRCQSSDWLIHKAHCDLIQHLSSQSQPSPLLSPVTVSPLGSKQDSAESSLSPAVEVER